MGYTRINEYTGGTLEQLKKVLHERCINRCTQKGMGCVCRGVYNDSDN